MADMSHHLEVHRAELALQQARVDAMDAQRAVTDAERALVDTHRAVQAQAEQQAAAENRWTRRLARALAPLLWWRR